jgi:hypothetical protein
MAEVAPSPVEIADTQPAELALPVPFCPDTQPAMEAPSMTEAAEADAGPALLAPAPAGAEACGLEEVSADEASGDSETQIVPADHGANKAENQEDQAMVAEGMLTDEWDANEDEDPVVVCKKCQQAVSIVETVVRTATERWCKSCNSLVTLLRRNMAWPPEKFNQLTLEQQQNFFKHACSTKSENGFRYARVKDVLITSLVKRSVSQRIQDVGGKYLPVSVYRQQGYLLPENFEQVAPRQWSEALGCWTFLLVEYTVRHKEIEETVHESILQAEKSIKKLKAEALPNGQVKSAKTGDAADSSVIAPKPLVLDLLTESEGEEQVGDLNGKEEKKRLAAEKKQQKQRERQEAAAARKEESKAKREAAVANRKIAALATKVVPVLSNTCKEAALMQKEASDKLGSPNGPQLAALSDGLTHLQTWKKAAAATLQAQAKCSGSQLDPLPFQTEKEVTAKVKEVQGHMSALKLLLKPKRPATAKGKAKAKAVAQNSGAGQD